MAYFTALYVLAIARTVEEQKRLLHRLALVTWTAEGPSSALPCPAANSLIGGVLAYINLYDEPPTVLGVNVDPALLNFLNRSLASLAASVAAGIVTSRLSEGGPH